MRKNEFRGENKGSAHQERISKDYLNIERSIL